MSEEKNEDAIKKLNEVSDTFKQSINNDSVLNSVSEDGKVLGRKEVEQKLKEIITKNRSEMFPYIIHFYDGSVFIELENLFRELNNHIAKIELSFAKYIEDEVEHLKAMKLVFEHVSSGTHRQISYRADLFTEILIKRLESLKSTDPKELLQFRRLDLYDLSHGSLSFAKIKAENFRLMAENEALKKGIRTEITANTEIDKLFG